MERKPTIIVSPANVNGHRRHQPTWPREPRRNYSHPHARTRRAMARTVTNAAILSAR